MELLIDKKYLLRLERYVQFGYKGITNNRAVRYVFKLPESAGLPEGYTIYIDVDSEYVHWNDEGDEPLDTDELIYGTYRLNRDENTMYEATMTEKREKGKRYKRFKFSLLELCKIYSRISIPTDAETAVASCLIYALAHPRELAGIKYLVGKVQGCWFYCSELDKKRRLDTAGTRILGKIRAEDEIAVRNIIRNMCGEQIISLQNMRIGRTFSIFPDIHMAKLDALHEERNKKDLDIIEALREYFNAFKGEEQ